MSDEQAQLIYGQGQEACPDGTFCLYRATNFNIGQTPGVGDKILAIPLGTYVNDFSVYGFDHSGDGVSSVVNNTDADNALFSAADQRGHSLPVDRRSSIANLARIAMADSPNGSWNDQAQSALAAPFLGNLVVEHKPERPAPRLRSARTGMEVSRPADLAPVRRPRSDAAACRLASDFPVRRSSPRPRGIHGTPRHHTHPNAR
ncbi:peptidase inhibitor family I36 protein [Streptomyces viridifaciens]|nr:hypothetical protein CP971_29010 [Streptomyces viridifaciens]UKZ09324.1 peptidase inhibitor family I36 protein [Streptomyces viridifaciens]